MGCSQLDKLNQSIQDLLFYVTNILQIKEKTAKQKEGDFTVFTALRNESDDVRTHSTFLYEMLRPDGCHGLKDAF